MTKTVVIAGALDTKGQEFGFVKELIEKEGLKTLVVDFGVMGSRFHPGYSTGRGGASGRWRRCCAL